MLDDDDEIEYEVFYNKPDIKTTLRRQDDNLFNDIAAMKKDVFKDFRMEGGPASTNKFFIEEWAPAEDQKEDLTKTMSKNQRKKSRMILDNSEKDLEEENDKVPEMDQSALSAL